MRLGIVAIARPTFDVAFAQEMAQAAAMSLVASGYEIEGNASLTMDETTLTRAIDRLRGVEVDALVVLQASFTDSSLAVQAANVDVPVVLWAFPEDRTGGRLRLNSLCGINLAAYTLTSMGRDYMWLYRTPEDPEAPREIATLLDRGRSRPEIATVSAGDEFGASARAAAEAVVTRLRTTTIGRVGERPDGFEPCSYEAGVLRSLLGVTVDELPLPEMFHRATQATDRDVAAARGRAAAFLSGVDDVDQIALDRSLRLNAGLRSLIDDGGWSGVATRCWPETFTEFGGAACTAMALLTEDGTPGSCEADVYGNITALILGWLGGSAAFVADLVHLDRQTDSGVFWHCGLAPFEMADPDVEPVATIHSNRRKPLLSEFPLKPGRVTLARVSQSRGQHRIVVGGGEMIRAPLAFSGTAGVVRFDRGVEHIVSTVMGEGLEHHFGIVYADVREDLRAIASRLGLPVVEL